jgi:hypothetical protein
MFFGLQPIKQNSPIAIGGRNSPSDFQTSPAVVQNPSASSASQATAKANGNARVYLANEVKVANSNGLDLGANTQVRTVLADAELKFNEAIKRGDLPAAQAEWKRAQRTFDAGNQLQYLERRADGSLQNAAIYLGVGYKDIKVVTPPTTSVQPNTSGLGGTNLQVSETTGTKAGTNSSSQVGNGTSGQSDIPTEVATELENLISIAKVALQPGATEEQKKLAQRQILETYQTMTPNYPKETFDMDSRSTMTELAQANPNLWSKQNSADAAPLLGMTAKQIEELNPGTLISLLLGLAVGDTSARNLLGHLLGELRKSPIATAPVVQPSVSNGYRTGATDNTNSSQQTELQTTEAPG